MRIITGKHRGRRINPPDNLPVRPTTDFAKESLFNILNNLIPFEDISVLDLFAGTGSISYEFFSRGAKLVTAVDNNPRCTAFIDRSAEAMNDTEVIQTRTDDALRFIKHAPGLYDVVFADPPYDMDGIDKIPDLVLNGNIMEKEGIFILEHSKSYDFKNHPLLTDHRQYGNVHFSFFRRQQT